MNRMNLIKETIEGNRELQGKASVKDNQKHGYVGMWIDAIPKYIHVVSSFVEF